MDLVDDDVMRKLLKHKKFKCSHCNLEFYVDKIKIDIKDEEQISKCICYKCLENDNYL